MKRSRFSRRRRWRTAVRDVARASAGKPALRLWQRVLIGPAAMTIDGVGSVLAWARDLFRFRSARILPLLPPGEFLVIGHRGSPVNAVENTIASFERAMEDGANAIETDLGVTRDGKVVLHHDWDPDGQIAFAREAGAEFDVAYRPVPPPDGSPLRRPVCDLTLADIRSAWRFARIDDDVTSHAVIPTIEDLLAWARRKPQLKMIVLDLKVPDERAELVEVILDEVEGARRRAPFHFETLYMTTQPKVLERIKARIADGDRTFDVEIPAGLGRKTDAISCTEPATRLGNNHASLGRPRATFGGWGIYHRILRKDLGSLVPGPSRIRRVICWTINRPREMRHLLNMGVHGILTDHPEVLLAQANRILRPPSSDRGQTPNGS